MFGSFPLRLLMQSAGSVEPSVASILGPTLHRHYDAAVIEPTGAPGGFFRWTDLSGNGFHADSASAPGNPTAGATINGQPAITFDGVANFLTTTETLAQCRIYHNGTVRAAQWIVYEPLSTAFKFLGGTNPDLAGATGHSTAQAPTVLSNKVRSAGTDYLNAPLGQATPSRVVLLSDFDGPAETLATVAWNTTASGSIVDNTPTGHPSAADPSGQFVLCKRPLISDFFNLRLAEWIVAVDPADAQVDAVSALLRSKYDTV